MGGTGTAFCLAAAAMLGMTAVLMTQGREGFQQPPFQRPDTLPAFPEARGWGAVALHDCRGLPLVVHRVTNTNAQGPGTFRAALEAVSDAAYDVIVFTTSGRIHWGPSQSVQFNTPRFACAYIAGQTAPGGGITIAGNLLHLRSVTRDVVLRYITFRKHRRLGFSPSVGIADHITSTWTGSGGGGSNAMTTGHPDSIPDYSPRNTISNSMIYEFHRNHPTGLVPRVHLGSFYGNYLAGPGWRLPLMQTDSLGGLEFVNNVIYNWRGGSNAATGTHNHVLDLVNNLTRRGPGTLATSSRNWYPFQHREQCQFGAGKCFSSVYIDGNRSDESDFRPLPGDSAWRGSQRQYAWQPTSPGEWDPRGEFQGDTVPIAYRRDVDLPTHLGVNARWPYVRREMTDAVLDSILATVGNSRGLACDGRWVLRRDSLDAAQIQHFYAGTGRVEPWDFVGRGIPGASPDPDELPVVPIPIAGTPCADADSDGIPDEWELLHCGSTTGCGADSVSVSGYLMIEHYLNGSDPADPTPWLLAERRPPSGSGNPLLGALRRRAGIAGQRDTADDVHVAPRTSSGTLHRGVSGVAGQGPRCQNSSLPAVVQGPVVSIAEPACAEAPLATGEGL